MLDYKEILQLSQKGLQAYLKSYLESKYNTVYATENYVFAVGNIPIGLVAHTDTVFYKPPRLIFWDKDYNVVWSPSGAGHDDRAGIYGILTLIEKGYRPSVFFPADEEIGDKGAKALVTDFPIAPGGLKYLIELDRQGIDDCVFYQCVNEPFIEFIESFGFKTKSGSFSDISAICPAWDIAGVNLSIGYIAEHSEMEHLFMDVLLKTIDKVALMLQIADETPEFKYYTELYGWDENCGITKEEWASFLGSKEKCMFCDTEDYSFNLLPVESGYCCPECRHKLHWCKQCGKPYIKYCKNCKGE